MNVNTQKIQYKSTRSNTNRYSFEEAVCSGYAPDGGLFIPETLPIINHTTLTQWTSLSFPELATQILRNFISEDELSTHELKTICHATVDEFDDMNHPIAVKPLSPSNPKVFISELFHGPTMCFKDFGLRFLIQLLSHYCTKRQKPQTIIVATTGDTGPAALASVCHANNPLLDIIIHYPHGQISNFQRKQLTCIKSERCRVVAFEGGGDDMDVPIKNILTGSGDGVCGVNSYNVARPLMQMVHFIWTYLRILETFEPNNEHAFPIVDYIIPTGAMGNIVAAYMAKLCGVPIGKLCAAVNVNDVSYRAITLGELYKSSIMHKTLSEAINIQLVSRFLLTSKYS